MKQNEDIENVLYRAGEYINEADVILVVAGAGMGVDAGIPDYYGGIHLAHPRLAEIGLSLYDLSNHSLFLDNPTLAWGHWLTRQRQYLNALPHNGYDILRSWSKSDKRHVRIVTTNLDRHFLRTGFSSENVFEMHGSMYDVQCINHCGVNPWSLDIETMPSVDLNTMILLGSPPLCIKCAGPTRVCTELAVDGHWNAFHIELARTKHEKFFRQLSSERMLTVLEIGCETVMTKLRIEAARIVAEHRMHGGRAAHIRINLYQADIDQHPDNISLPLRALEALQKLNQLIIN